MRVELAPSAFGQPGYGLVEQRLVNLFHSETPAGPGQTARLPRPALSDDYTAGIGATVGMFQADGVFSGDRFKVTGTTVYREGVAVGDVARGGIARFAASSDQLVVVVGGRAYVYNGSSFAQITIPDGQGVVDAFYLAGRFYFLVDGTDRIYFSVVNNAADVDGLAFFTAESGPDANVGALVLGDEAAFFNRVSVEFWGLSGNAAAPMQRAIGRKLDVGCASLGSIVRVSNYGGFFIGSDRAIYRTNGAPVPSWGIETRLRRCTNIEGCTAFAVTFEGHAFYVLAIPGEGTFAYDITTDRWSQWASYNRQLFRCSHAIMVGAQAYLGDRQSGAVFRFDPAGLTDAGEPIERLASFFIPVDGPTRCNNIVLHAALGVGSEAGSDPVVELRHTDTHVDDWSSWIAEPLGKIGQTAAPPIFRGLGLMNSPGRYFEARITEPALAVFSFAEINARR